MDHEVASICEAFLESLKETVYAECGAMLRIWMEIGLDRGDMTSRLEFLADYSKKFLKNSVAKEAGKLRCIQRDVESYVEQVIELRRELGHALDDLSNQRGMTLLEQNNYLTDQLRCLADEKVARMAEVIKLDERIEALTEQLGQQSRLRSLTQVPSADQLEERTAYVFSLEKEISGRVATIEREQRQIQNLLRQLERGPDGPYEQNLIIGAPLSLISTQTLHAVETMRQRLEAEVERNRNHADQLRDRLSSLWRLMQLPNEAERSSYLASHSDHRPTIIRQLEEEVRVQEVNKLERIGFVITNMRSELLELWQKCFYSEEQKAEFTDFQDDNYTEALLDKHTKELENLTNLYNNNKSVWDMITKRSHLWTKMLDLEFRASNPSRYNNRGGRLLQEERERRKLLNQIPKLEQEISDKVLASEADHGVRIMIFGEPAADYISHQWDDMREQKENQKLERQQAKVQLLKHEMQEGCKQNNTTRRRFVATPLSSPLLKMTRSNTPLTVTAHTSAASGSVAVTGRPPTSTKTTLRKVSALPRPRRLNQHKNSFKANPNSLLCNRNAGNTSRLNDSALSTYSTFTKNLHIKSRGDNCRSSAVTPSTPIAAITTTPRRYRDRLGLPFLL